MNDFIIENYNCKIHSTISFYFIWEIKNERSLRAAMKSASPKQTLLLPHIAGKEKIQS